MNLICKISNFIAVALLLVLASMFYQLKQSAAADLLQAEQQFQQLKLEHQEAIDYIKTNTAHIKRSLASTKAMQAELTALRAQHPDLDKKVQAAQTNADEYKDAAHTKWDSAKHGWHNLVD